MKGTAWERLACGSCGEKPPHSAHKRALSLGPELGLDGHMSADTQVHTQHPEERHTWVFLRGTHLGSCQLHFKSTDREACGLDGSRGSLHLPGAPGRQFTVLPVNRAAPGGSAAAEPLWAPMNRVLQRGMCAARTLGAPGICVMHVTAQNPPLWTHPHKLLSTVGRPKGWAAEAAQRVSQNHQHKRMENWENYPEGRKNCNHSSLLKMSC